MVTLKQYGARGDTLRAKLGKAVEEELGPCYEAALVKNHIPRPFPKPEYIASGLAAQGVMRSLTDDPAHAKLKAAIKKCDKDHKVALDGLGEKFNQLFADLEQEAYDSKVLAPAMILTDAFWLPRAKKMQSVTSSGWNKKGRWSLGDRPAIIFEVNTIAQLKAFVSKERRMNTLLILLQRLGLDVRVAGEWRTLAELALTVNHLGPQVRVGNVIALGADDDLVRDAIGEQALLEAFHSELFEIYEFDEAAMTAKRTAAVTKVLADAKKVLAKIKNDAADYSIAANDDAAKLTAFSGLAGLAGNGPLSAALAIASGAMWWLANRYAEQAKDPPRGDYAKRAAFQPVSLPTPSGADSLLLQLTDLSTALLNEAIALDALRISAERLDGADQAAPNIGDDMRFVQRQARTASGLASAVQEQIALTSQLLTQLQKEWAKMAKATPSSVVPTDFYLTMNKAFDEARDVLKSAGVSTPVDAATAFKKALRDQIAPTVGTSQGLPASFPPRPALQTTAKQMKSWEQSFERVTMTIESG